MGSKPEGRSPKPVYAYKKSLACILLGNAYASIDYQSAIRILKQEGGHMHRYKHLLVVLNLDDQDRTTIKYAAMVSRMAPIGEGVFSVCGLRSGYTRISP